MKSPYLLFCLLIIGFFNSTAVFSQTKAEKTAARKAEIKELITSKKFTFNAHSTMTGNGDTQQLDNGYYITLNGDSVISYLPYYGVAHNSVQVASEDASTFQTTSFVFQTGSDSKSWLSASIRFTESQEPSMFYFDFTDDGYATVIVTSLNKRSITYSGDLVMPKPEKKKK